MTLPEFILCPEQEAGQYDDCAPKWSSNRTARFRRGPRRPSDMDAPSVGLFRPGSGLAVIAPRGHCCPYSVDEDRHDQNEPPPTPGSDIPLNIPVTPDLS